jgi:hypothetical protein
VLHFLFYPYSLFTTWRIVVEKREERRKKKEERRKKKEERDIIGSRKTLSTK